MRCSSRPGRSPRARRSAPRSCWPWPRASQKAGNHGRAIADFQAYLSEYPKGADRTAARYGLGESQLAAGQPLPARLTWTDLARDLEKVDTKEAADTRARALYGIARTHGIPAPPDDAQMNLGVAALRRMLAAYPSHPLAVRAAYEIATSYLARGKSQEALAALRGLHQGGRPAAATTTRPAASGPSC